MVESRGTVGGWGREDAECALRHMEFEVPLGDPSGDSV